jgi:hypothetical protein
MCQYATFYTTIIRGYVIKFETIIIKVNDVTAKVFKVLLYNNKMCYGHLCHLSLFRKKIIT